MARHDGNFIEIKRRRGRRSSPHRRRASRLRAEAPWTMSNEMSETVTDQSWSTGSAEGLSRNQLGAPWRVTLPSALLDGLVVIGLLWFLQIRGWPLSSANPVMPLVVMAVFVLILSGVAAMHRRVGSGIGGSLNDNLPPAPTGELADTLDKPAAYEQRRQSASATFAKWLLGAVTNHSRPAQRSEEHTSELQS